MELDPTRLRIMRLIQASDTDSKNASRRIGKNDAYLCLLYTSRCV